MCVVGGRSKCCECKCGRRGPQVRVTGRIIGQREPVKFLLCSHFDRWQHPFLAARRQGAAAACADGWLSLPARLARFENAFSVSQSLAVVASVRASDNCFTSLTRPELVFYFFSSKIICIISYLSASLHISSSYPY